jgi:hypothetical protein
MEDNKIFFEIKDNKVHVTYEHPTLTLPDFLQVISTGVLQAMISIVAAAPEDQRTQVKEELYDMYNAAASNTLNYFAPEIEMRPHLTAQAILEAEDNIINRQYKKTANRKQRRAMEKKEASYLKSLKGGK